jgi:hypothetical protein
MRTIVTGRGKQWILLELIGNNGITKSDVLAEMLGIQVTEELTLALIDDLIAKRLIGWDGNKLVFLTQRRATIIVKDGFLVDDMVDEGPAEWMAGQER